MPPSSPVTKIASPSFALRDDRLPFATQPSSATKSSIRSGFRVVCATMASHVASPHSHAGVYFLYELRCKFPLAARRDQSGGRVPAIAAMSLRQRASALRQSSPAESRREMPPSTTASVLSSNCRRRRRGPAPRNHRPVRRRQRHCRQRAVKSWISRTRSCVSGHAAAGNRKVEER